MNTAFIHEGFGTGTETIYFLGIVIYISETIDILRLA
jgi:hypothetical protein